jgi:hypothetical protein
MTTRLPALKNSVSHAALNRACASTVFLAAAQEKTRLPATIDTRHPAAIPAKYVIDHATWPSVVASARLPTGEFDEERVIDCIADVVSMVRYRMEREGSLEAIKAAIERLLRAGRLRFTITTIERADKGDEIADAALRTVFAEMVGGMFPERGPGHLQIWAYGQRAVLREAHRRPRGHRWHDDWMRNILACHLIVIVERDFGIRPSRNRSPSERMDGKRKRRNADALSGIGIVVKALARHGIELAEMSAQENIWFGPAGEIVRSNIETVDNHIS